MFCWGANHLGQVGHELGAAPIEPYASEVDLPERAVAVSAGGYHSCAILAGGTVYCWGANDHGQLGDGTFVGGPDPTRVAFPADLHFVSAMEVSAGGEHTCAIFRAEYNIRRTACWGRNSTLQLGTTLVGAGVDSPVPLRVTAFGPQGNASADVVSISAGNGHTCARDVENALSCWGSNQDGQLGNALAPSQSAAAFQVLGLSPATRLLGRGSVASHACTVDQLNQLRCWGSHRYGQLGTGEPADMAPHYSPATPAWP